MLAWLKTRSHRRQVARSLYGSIVTRAREAIFYADWGVPGTRVTGWLSDDEVMVLTSAGESDFVRMYAHAVPVDGGASRRLPYGWAGDVALGPDGGALLSSFFWSEPAAWKHYRGGTASQLWLDLDGSGPSLGAGTLDNHVQMALRESFAEALKTKKTTYRLVRRAADNEPLLVAAVTVFPPQASGESPT